MGIKFFLLAFLLIFMLGLRFWYYYKEIPEYTHGQRFSGVFVINDEPEIISGRQSFRIIDDFGTRIKVVTSTSPLLKFGD